MSSASFTATPRLLWRALNWMADTQDLNKQCRIANAINTQEIEYEHLADLEDRGWVQYWLPTDTEPIEFQWADMTSRFLITGTLRGTMTFTDSGRRKLTHPYNRVLRYLRPYRYRPGPHAEVKAIARGAEVTPQVLTDMAAVDLITSTADVPLTVFRRLPARLRLRLTAKGESYLRQGVIEVGYGQYR